MTMLDPDLLLVAPMFVVPCPSCPVELSAATEADAYALYAVHEARYHDARTFSLHVWKRGEGWLQMQTGANRVDAQMFVRKHSQPRVVDEATGEEVSFL